MDTNPDPNTLAQAMSARKSVVTILIEKNGDDGNVLDGQGSGFIIKSRGNRAIVLTCNHVIRGSLGFDKRKDKIFVRGMSENSGIPWQVQGQLMKMNTFVDLAIIKVTGLPERVEELKFVASENLPLGTSVIAVGYSYPEDVFHESDDHICTVLPVVSPGAISGPIMVSEQYFTVKEDIPISCVSQTGFSGCPVISSGGVIGVLASGYSQISLAISTETINRILKKWRNIEDDDNITIEGMIDMFRI